MESLIFHIEADKADTNMLESIRAFFGSRRVQISVTPEAQSLVELEVKVEKNRQSGVAYVFEGDSFATLTEQLLNDEAVDVQGYKQTLR
ncbi:MAG: hypothetical protein EAZ91_06075 [Cytophagales bacterium]|nr:MAG: hypothetical protein EAZ91_06075 [Cytophagales bacterium]